MPIHVRQVQIQEDQVIVIELGEIDPLLTQIGAVYVQVRVRQHEFNAARGGGVIFDQEDSHGRSPG
jgi:hypothetical protein